MPSITASEVKTIRQEIRKAFPRDDGWNWSVTIMDHNIGVKVTLIQYPKGYKFPSNLVIDHHAAELVCKENGLVNKECDAIQTAISIVMKPYKEKAESVNDWQPSHIFYVSFSIGSWDAPATEAES